MGVKDKALSAAADAEEKIIELIMDQEEKKDDDKMNIDAESD